MPRRVFNEGLSSAQRAFALRHEASSGLRAASSTRGVFLYRQAPEATYRWLVRDDGRVVESSVYRKPSRSRG